MKPKKPTTGLKVEGNKMDAREHDRELLKAWFQDPRHYGTVREIRRDCPGLILRGKALLELLEDMATKGETCIHDAVEVNRLGQYSLTTRGYEVVR